MCDVFDVISSYFVLFFFKQKTAYEMRISDWSSDVCSSDLFRVAGGDAATMRITNAGGSAYPGGWPGYKVRASTDRETWRKVETTYANGVLEWRWPGGAPLVWFAYFAPYPVERHNKFITDYDARNIGRSARRERVGQ